MSDQPITRATPVIDPQRVAVVWIDSDRAAISTWQGEPTVEHVESGVAPRRRAVGSVRRGPARPEGGGRVAGHGTKEKHERDLAAFLATVASRLVDLDTIEVIGRGSVQERFAGLLRSSITKHNKAAEVTTRRVARRPSDAQLQARLRKLSGTELPRRTVGRYRLPAAEPTTATGRPLRPAAGRRTLKPARLPENKHIAEENELMLADPPTDPAE